MGKVRKDKKVDELCTIRPDTSIDKVNKVILILCLFGVDKIDHLFDRKI